MECNWVWLVTLPPTVNIWPELKTRVAVPLTELLIVKEAQAAVVTSIVMVAPATRVTASPEPGTTEPTHEEVEFQLPPVKVEEMLAPLDCSEVVIKNATQKINEVTIVVKCFIILKLSVKGFLFV